MTDPGDAPSRLARTLDLGDTVFVGLGPWSAPGIAVLVPAAEVAGSELGGATIPEGLPIEPIR